MAFLNNLDKIIIMDQNATDSFVGRRCVALTVDELKRLQDVGVHTVCEYYTWSRLELKMGEYSWAETDEMVKRVRDVGLRVVLCGYNAPLQCAPDGWYCQYQGGRVMKDILSFWNPDAQRYAQEHYRMMIQRYGGADCMVAMCEYLTGESVLWNQPVFYDPAAQVDYADFFGEKREPTLKSEETVDWLSASAVRHYLDTQAVLVGQHNEIWEDLQWAIAGQSVANATFAQPCIQECCRAAWPHVQYTCVQYTYFGHPAEYMRYIEDLRIKNGLKLIVEANYCKGLQDGSYKVAKSNHADGQMCGPLHNYAGNFSHLEDWQVETIKTAIDYWGDK